MIIFDKNPKNCRSHVTLYNSFCWLLLEPFSFSFLLMMAFARSSFTSIFHIIHRIIDTKHIYSMNSISNKVLFFINNYVLFRKFDKILHVRISWYFKNKKN